jgi:ubiquinone biosynthesis protein UbiJ
LVWDRPPQTGADAPAGIAGDIRERLAAVRGVDSGEKRQADAFHEAITVLAERVEDLEGRLARLEREARERE